MGVVHGKNDEVVDYHCAEKFVQDRDNVTLELLDADHQMLGAVDKLWDLTRQFFAL